MTTPLTHFYAVHDRDFFVDENSNIINYDNKKAEEQ